MLGAAFLGIETFDQLYIVLGVTAAIGPFLVAMAFIAFQAWQRTKDREAERERFEIEADLKGKMIERGMSADEIARVLSVRLPDDQPPRRT